MPEMAPLDPSPSTATLLSLMTGMSRFLEGEALVEADSDDGFQEYYDQAEEHNEPQVPVGKSYSAPSRIDP